ncbi:hypothetical protein [Gorillibacterium timonense]|uniref:hypothetical protein n=1 Tax=Gorillibacterium timonense TaxID=1689269 RepID=UPI0011DDD358|nr:hypothetical protein [Gorillibacterium timonense]
MKHPSNRWMICWLTLLLVGAAFGTGTGVAASATPGKSEPSHENRRTYPGYGAERIYSEAASVLGMSKEDLKKELTAGKSLADVAQAKGKSREQLIADLSARTSAFLDKEVKSGELTKQAAERIKERVGEKLPWFVDVKGLAFPGREGGPHSAPRGLLTARLPELAAALGMTKEGLQMELASGKSLAEIAAKHGMSREQLIAMLKEQLTPTLEKLIDHKQMPSGPPAASSSPRQENR